MNIVKNCKKNYIRYNFDIILRNFYIVLSKNTNNFNKETMKKKCLKMLKLMNYGGNISGLRYNI